MSLLICLGANRCLRFNYVISNRNVGSSAVTSLNVYIMGDSGTTSPPHVFDTHTANSWVQAEIDLPSMENMKVILYNPWTKKIKPISDTAITKNFINSFITFKKCLFTHNVIVCRSYLKVYPESKNWLLTIFEFLPIYVVGCYKLNKHLYYISALYSGWEVKSSLFIHYRCFCFV